MKYEVRCNKVNTGESYGNNSKLVGLASIVIDGKFAINNIKVVTSGPEGDEMYYINYPSRKSSKTKSGYCSIAHPLDGELSEKLDEAILDSYDASGEVKVVETATKFELSVSVLLYDKEGTNIRGISDVHICNGDEFRVHDILIREGKNGLFMSMPSYPKKDGTYANIINPTTRELYQELDNELKEAYQRAVNEKEQKQSAEKEQSVNSGTFRHSHKRKR